MKYAVDRIEDNIAVLENITTKEKKEVELTSLPSEVHEKAILMEEKGIFKIDTIEEENRKKILREKMERLKKLKNN